MPVFFFDIHQGGRLTADEFGDEFDGIEDARKQAISILPDLARDVIPAGEHQEFGCDVRDASNVVVYRARLTFRGEWPDGERPPRPSLSRLLC